MDDLSHAEIYWYFRGYFQTGIIDGELYDLKPHSFIPQLQHRFDLLFAWNEYQKIPLLSQVFSPALYMWLTLLIAARSLVKKQSGVFAVSILLLAYCATLFLGPCILIRYIYPLVAIVPMQLMMSFHKEENPDQ